MDEFYDAEMHNRYEEARYGGEEIDIRDLPPMSGEELGELLVNLVVKQNERIRDLESQLKERGRDWEQTRAEQDAALWREGVIR